MSAQDPIDDLFKGKLDQRQFAFDPGAWAAAEELIREDERKGLLFRWLWWGTGGLVALVLGGLLVGNVLSGDPAATGLAEKNSETARTEITEDHSMVQARKTKRLLSESTETSSATEQPSNTGSQTTATTPVTRELAETTSILEEPVASVELAENDGEGSTSVENPAEVNEGGANNTDDVTPDLPALDAPAVFVAETTTDQNDQTNTRDDADRMGVLIISYIGQNRLTDVLTREDTLPVIRLEPLKPIDRLSFGVQAGATAARGLENRGIGRASVSYGPIVGAWVSYRFAPRVSMNLAPGYSSRAGLNSSVTYRNSAAGLVTTLSPARLHYLDIPVYFRWNANPTLGVTFGGQVSRLLYAQTDRQRVITGTNGENTLINETLIGQQDGFSSTEAAFILGADYQVSSRFRIWTRGQFGIFDMTDDDYFQNSVSDKDLQFRFGLEYQIFGR